jgi:hypothetical protein
MATDESGHRVEEKIEAFVAVEGTREADDFRPPQSEGVAERFVGRGVVDELFDVDRVRDDGDLRFGDIADEDVGLQPFADRGDFRGVADGPRFQAARDPITDAAFLRGAVVDGGVFP